MQAFHFVCDLVQAKYIENSKELREWADSCKENASNLHLFESRQDLMDRMESQLSQLNLSHLHVYSPVEDKEVWQGKSLENGLLIYGINGSFIVSGVLPKSPASDAGIKAGDIVVSIEGEVPLSEWQVRSARGHFKFDRQGHSYDLFLETKELTIDERPNVSAINKQTAHLKISSFRQEYFKKKDWKKTISQFKNYLSMVVDLRGNRGGDFVAGLRALSPFFCEETKFGVLYQRPKGLKPEINFNDNMDDDSEFTLLMNYQNLTLKSFNHYGCFKGATTVLIDKDTSSVAEIFADAMMHRPNTRVWGESSAGEVVLAVFYIIPHLGKGYSLSIPEASYKSVSGEAIEGSGVVPYRWLHYDFDEAIKGQDSWLLRALEK